MIEFKETATHIQVFMSDFPLINVKKEDIEGFPHMVGMPFEHWLYCQLEMTPTLFFQIMQQLMTQAHEKYLENKS